MDANGRKVRSLGAVAAGVVIAAGMTACSSGAPSASDTETTTVTATVTTVSTAAASTVTVTPSGGAAATKTVVVTAAADGPVSGDDSSGGNSPGARDCDAQTGSWTTADKTATMAVNAPMRKLDAAVHDCFDRIVIELGPSAQAPGYQVGYVDAVHAQGSGTVVALAGKADLQLVIDSPAYDAESGSATYDPADPAQLVDTSGFPVLRQIASGGSFEGQTTIGVGVSRQLPFQLSTVSGPGSHLRLVLDIAHPSV